MGPIDVIAKLNKLIAEGEAVLGTRKTQKFHNGQESHSVDRSQSTTWLLNAGLIVRGTLGADSEHYKRIANYLSSTDASSTEVILATLRSVVVAVTEGYAFDLRRLVRADVESDLVEQATTLLGAGYARASAVLAGAVVEAHLRHIAPSWGVTVTDARGKHLTLEPLNVELKRASAYDGLMKNRITTLGSLRNDAAHGGAFAASDEDVKRMITDANDICDRVRTK